jgi:hypothetical protein
MGRRCLLGGRGVKNARGWFLRGKGPFGVFLKGLGGGEGKDWDSIGDLREKVL